MSLPSKKTVPDVGLSKPFKCSTNVDFPEPVCPIIPIISPWFTEKETLFTALNSNGVDAS